MKMPKACAS